MPENDPLLEGLDEEADFFASIKFDAPPSEYSETDALTDQAMANARWRELCEEALACKISSNDGLFLLALSKAIMDDPYVFQATVVPGSALSKSSLEAVRGFTLEQKHALRGRLRGLLKNILK